MIVFHGGTDIVDFPRIVTAHSGRDFGAGFYTTDIREQAVKWAKRQALYRKKAEGVLNTYEFDDSALKILKVKTFDDYSMDWLDFVIECRRDAAYGHGFDVVIGKIANDDVGETVQAVIDGLTPKDFALSKLVFMHVNNQICFSTDNALGLLSFVSSERVV